MLYILYGFIKESKMIYTNTEEIFLHIRKLMLSEKVTVTELAKRLNKSQPATSALLKQKNVSLDTLKDICDALNCKIEINISKIED